MRHRRRCPASSIPGKDQGRAGGWLLASVLSKKAAAGATHLVLDLPVGATAKLRSSEAAQALSNMLVAVAASLDIETRVVLSDGSQPVGRGIGPALEARDVLAVLRGDAGAPQDLAERAIALAGALLELAGAAPSGTGPAAAAAALADGRAWRKFQAICEAQGGMRTPAVARWRHPVTAKRAGRVLGIDNRRIARVAKLAGAPEANAAGLELQVRVGDPVIVGAPLFTIHAESPGELAYSLDYAMRGPEVVAVREDTQSS